MNNYVHWPNNLTYERKIAAPWKHIFVHYPCKTQLGDSE